MNPNEDIPVISTGTEQPHRPSERSDPPLSLRQNPPIRSTEDLTSKILHALANPIPPPNLEHRILQTLYGQSLTPARLQTTLQRLHAAAQTLWRTPSGAIAAAALLAIAILTVSSTISHHQTHTAHLPSPTTNPSPKPNLASHPVAAPPIPPTLRRLTQPSPHPSPELTTSANVPPPPLPLTEEEKLLRQIAHTRDPKQLALLNPELRAREQAADEAEFQTFFKPPPPLPDLDQTQPATPATPNGDTL